MAKDIEMLRKLAEEYEEKARSIRTALAELNGHATTKAQATIHKKLRHATELHADTRSPDYASMGRHDLYRARLDALRDFMKPGEGYHPETLHEHLVSIGFPPSDLSTVRNALIAMKASHNGRAREQSRWTLGKSGRGRPKAAHSTKSERAYHTGAAIKARRQDTAQLLARLAKQDDPVPTSFFGKGAAVGVLIQHGYIAKKGEGYVRTEKEFTV